jgi:hypothetical protein
MKTPIFNKPEIKAGRILSPLIVRMVKKSLLKPNCIVCTLLGKLRLVLKQVENIFTWLYTSQKIGDLTE